MRHPAALTAVPELTGPGDRLVAMLRTLREDLGVPTQSVVNAIEAAVPAAWAQLEPAAPPLRVTLDTRSGSLRLELSQLVVVGAALGPEQISLADAVALEPDARAGEWLRRPAQLSAAVAARASRLAQASLKDALRQARRERLRGAAESGRGQLVDTLVERFERGTAYLRAGELLAYLPPQEQIPGGPLVRGRHLKVVLMESRPEAGEEMLQVRASRANGLLLRRLLESEVPELAQGTVVLRAVTREPGERSKVAVESLRPGIDAKGACIGPKGVRIRAVVAELNGERVDVVEWATDPAQLVARALAPAQVERVELDSGTRRARVLVPARQLSLAIGKEGQNARLAARLSGWRIDIRSAEAGP
ncbi:MAG: transcription termination factor NusA [Candidatus Dormibacteria bacterium]